MPKTFFVLSFLILIAHPAFGQSSCGFLFEALADARSQAAFREEYLQNFRKIKTSPSSFKKLMRQRRSEWKGSAQSVPVPEFRSLVNYLSLALKETKSQLLPSDRRLVERQSYLDQLVQEAQKINSDPMGPAYDKVILFALRASEGFEFLDNYNGSPLESDIEKIVLKGGIISYGPYRIDVSDTNNFLLPVPFGVYYPSTSRLWAYRVFIVGSGKDLHAGGSRRIFTQHDIFHIGLRLESKQKSLSDESVDAFLDNLRAATEKIDTEELKKYGLSKEDLPVFLEVLDVAEFFMIHEANITEENPPAGRPNFMAKESASLLMREVYRVGIPIDEKPAAFIRAAIDWCNDFWAKNATP